PYDHGIHGADACRRDIDLIDDGERGLLVGHGEIAAGKTLGGKAAQRRLEIRRPHGQQLVGAIDAMLLQPEAVQQGRARMLDRPAHDASANHGSTTPWPRRKWSSGSSGKPRIEK